MTAKERGLDHHVGRSFDYPELAARIGAVLRLSQDRRSQGLLQVGELRVVSVGL